MTPGQRWVEWIKRILQYPKEHLLTLPKLHSWLGLNPATPFPSRAFPLPPAIERRALLPYGNPLPGQLNFLGLIEAALVSRGEVSRPSEGGISCLGRGSPGLSDHSQPCAPSCTPTALSLPHAELETRTSHAPTGSLKLYGPVH